jgi:hypothetical protein
VGPNCEKYQNRICKMNKTRLASTTLWLGLWTILLFVSIGAGGTDFGWVVLGFAITIGFALFGKK